MVMSRPIDYLGSFRIHDNQNHCMWTCSFFWCVNVVLSSIDFRSFCMWKSCLQADRAVLDSHFPTLLCETFSLTKPFGF